MVCCKCKALSLTMAGVAVSVGILLQEAEPFFSNRLEPQFDAPALYLEPHLVALEQRLGTFVQDRRPKYARVNGDIETLWQAPRSGPVKGALFMAHGCKHQATDFFERRGQDGWELEACSHSNFGRCLGLPEERQLVSEARSRGYYVVAVSSTGHARCWSGGDVQRAKAALAHVFQAEGLDEGTPVLATGASSGGAFMSSLALELQRPPKCVVPQVSALHDVASFASLKVPTLFVHMKARDPGTATRIESDIKELRQKGVLVKELQVDPVPLRGELEAHLGHVQAAAIESALQSGGFLQNGLLTADPRASTWRHAVGLKVDGDSLVADESPLAELLNVAFARHEFTARFAAAMLDFCEGGRLPSEQGVL